jgi:hypothetical protein
MTRRYMCLPGLLLLTMLAVADGATLKNMEEAKELAEKVLTRVVAGNIEGIATAVKPYWSFSEDELEALVTQTAQQRLLVVNRLGKSIGFTFVRRELAADTFLRLIYIERCEHTGLRWLFTFYKVKDVWKFHGFAWDEEIAQLFSSGQEPGRRDPLPSSKSQGTNSR